MNDPTPTSEAARRYSEAHHSQYAKRDLTGAVRAYERLVSHHPDTLEAGYARFQIQNLVQQVVPAGVLLEAQVSLLLRHLRPGAPPLRVGS